jgi:tetratricopeptide (TPR) repeat protein
MCEAADSLRLAGRYSDADILANRVLRDPSARVASSRDAVSTALVQVGLIALDRGDTDWDRIESLFRQGLQVFENLVATEPSGKYEAENDIWRARIYNNLGLVFSARGEYHKCIEFYERSLRLKSRHHELYGIAQTYGNLAKTEILVGRLPRAVAALNRIVEQLKRTPDIHICADTVSGCLTALIDKKNVSLRIRSPMDVQSKSERWWRGLLRQSHALSPSVKSVLTNLYQLRVIRNKLHTPHDRFHGTH